MSSSLQQGAEEAPAEQATSDTTPLANIASEHAAIDHNSQPSASPSSLPRRGTHNQGNPFQTKFDDLLRGGTRDEVKAKLVSLLADLDMVPFKSATNLAKELRDKFTPLLGAIPMPATDSVVDARSATTVQPTAPFKPKPGSKDFFSLGVSIRNKIYNYYVEGKTLTIVHVKYFARPPLPAMLFVSKQVRQEFRPILVTKARWVPDQDFVPINRRWMALSEPEQADQMEEWLLYFDGSPSTVELAKRAAEDDMFADMFDPLRKEWPDRPDSN